MSRLDLVTLEGQHVRLEPLSRNHLDDLCETGLDPELWRLIPYPVETREQMAAYIDAALADWTKGMALPFAVIARESSRAIGSTRFCAIDLPNKRLEIGWTWYGAAYQRTPVNTESKLLLLMHAFESLNLNRVEFKTDMLNLKSRAALTRIGAVQEGVFRRHMVCQSGRLRDSVYFSIIAEDWPQAKQALESKLAR